MSPKQPQTICQPVDMGAFHKTLFIKTDLAHRLWFAEPWSTRQLNGMESASLASHGPHPDPLPSSSFAPAMLASWRIPAHSCIRHLRSWPPFWVWDPLLGALCRPGSCSSFKCLLTCHPLEEVFTCPQLSVGLPTPFPRFCINSVVNLFPRPLFGACLSRRQGSTLLGSFLQHL